MNTPDRIALGINIGNTNCDVALVNCADFSVVDKRRIGTARGADEIFSLVNELVCGQDKNLPIRISSVMAGFAAELSASICNAGFEDVMIINGMMPDFKTDYRTPETLGADRIADAVYAKKRFAEKSVIVIDAGTAVTVDLVWQDGIFGGGYIMPGLSLLSSALSKGTSQLPFVNNGLKEDLPPLSTKDAISAGVSAMYVGGINRAVANLRAVCPDAIVLATGGGFFAVEDVLEFDFLFDENLTVIGAAWS